MKATLFADHPDDESSDFDRVCEWLQRWGSTVTIADYSTGGWEHIWNVDAPLSALRELPKRFFCQGAWAEYPCVVGDDDHPAWASHPEDGMRS